MTRRPIWIGAAALLFLVLMALYAASPWLAAARLAEALKSGDPAAIDRMVDFPAVRASLSSQITSRMNAEMRGDPETANNPFAGLVTLLAPALVNQMVGMVVTPDGLAKLSREARKAAAADEAADRARGKKHDNGADERPGEPALAYTGLNTFTATYSSRGKGSMIWTLGREKFFFWKLKKVEVSEIVLDDLTDDAERRK
jgi:hypothetical protein